jgi:hypothetical protein
VTGQLHALATGASRRGFRRWAARVSLVLLFLVLISLTVQAAGESGRRDDAITAALQVERSRTDTLVAKLERQVRAGCRFDRQMAELPKLAEQSHRPVTPILAEWAAAGREGYVIKGCQEAGFGPVPPVYQPGG